MSLQALIHVSDVYDRDEEKSALKNKLLVRIYSEEQNLGQIISNWNEWIVLAKPLSCSKNAELQIPWKLKSFLLWFSLHGQDKQQSTAALYNNIRPVFVLSASETILSAPGSNYKLKDEVCLNHCILFCLFNFAISY